MKQVDMQKNPFAVSWISLSNYLDLVTKKSISILRDIKEDGEIPEEIMLLWDRDSKTSFWRYLSLSLSIYI